MEMQHSKCNTMRTRHLTGQDRKVTKLIKQSAAKLVVYLLLLTTTFHNISNAQASSPQNQATHADQLPQSSNGSRARLLTKRQPSPAGEAEPLDDSQSGPHFQPLALDSANSDEALGPQSTGCSSSSQAARGGNKYRTLYACEEKQLQIECQLGESIQVIRANYGRFSLSLCNDHGLVDLRVNCMAPSSTTIIANSCTGKQSCQLLASNSIFGDPCPFTQKYLEVHYQCVCNAANNRTQEQQHRLDDKPSQRAKQPNVILQQATGEQLLGSVATSTTSERPQQWPAPGHLPPWMPSEVAALSTMRPPPPTAFSTAPSQRARCPEIVWRQIRWPATEAGQAAQQPCPAHTLPVTADTPSLMCLPSANWASHLQGARCQSLWLRNLTQRLEAGDSPLSSLAELVLKTRPVSGGWSSGPQQQQGLFGDDVALIGRVVRRLVDEMGEMLNRIADDKQRMVFAREMVQLLVELLNNLAADRLDAWTDLGQLAAGERQRLAGQLAQSLERAAVLLAGSQAGEHLAELPEASAADSFVRATDNVYLAIRSLPNTSGNRSLQVTFPNQQSTLGTKWMSAEQSFTLHLQTAPASDPLQSAQVDVKPADEQQTSSALKIVFVMLRGLGNQMGPSEVQSPQDESRMIVNSNLVSMSIVADARYKYAPIKVDLAAPIELVFQHLRIRGETSGSNNNPLCAYWDTNHSGWLTDGCKLIGTNRTHSTCACNHLTSFALLADSNAVSDELQLLATVDPSSGLLDANGQNQQQQSRAEQPKVQLDSVDNELSVGNGKTLYLAKMLDGLLFASDSSATSAPNARLLIYVSCLLSALLLALQLAAAAYNQTQARRLLGAMPSQPPPSLLVANQTILRRPQVNAGSTNSDVSPTYSSSDYSAALANTKSKLEQGVYSGSDRHLPRVAQLRVPIYLVFQMLALQLLIMLLAETQSYLQRNISPARVSAAQTAALLGFPLFTPQPVPLTRDWSNLVPALGPITWTVAGSLYYLVAAFTCWLIGQLLRLNLTLWRVASYSQHLNSCTISSSSSSGASDKSAHYGATNSTNLSASVNPVSASIYGRSLYGPAAMYGQQQHQHAVANLRGGTSPSSSFSSTNGHSLADNQTHRTLARLEDSARLYAAAAAASAGDQRPAKAKGLQLMAEMLPGGLVEHALPAVLVALVGWLTLPNSRGLNSLFYTSSLCHQLAYWPLLVDASSTPLALILYYAPAVCLVLASLAVVRLRRRAEGRVGGSAAIGSIVNPYGSSSLAVAIGARNGALDLGIGANNVEQQALNKQSVCENGIGTGTGTSPRPSYSPADAKRAKFLCGWLVALLALHSICWISFFAHVQQTINTPSSRGQSLRLVYAFAASNFTLVLLLTWLQRRSLRRAASLLGVGQVFSRCCLCLCQQSAVGSRASRARFYRAASRQQATNGDIKVSASSQSLFLSNQQQHYGQQQQPSANGNYLYSSGYHSTSQAQQHLYHQLGQHQQAHIYDSANNTLSEQQHRLNMLQMMQQQQQQQLHQVHQFDQQQQHNFALNRSMSSLNHPQQHQMAPEQRQPMTLKPMANNILPMMFNQQRVSPTSQTESQQAANGQLLVLDAAAALKQQQQQQFNLHLAADQQSKTMMARNMQQQQQQSGEADGPLVAFNNSNNSAGGQPPTTFGPTTNSLAPARQQQQATFHQHQLSGRQLFSERRQSPSPQMPINCISDSSALHLASAASGRTDPASQHQYCSIGAENSGKSYATDLQQQQQHFRHASGKLLAQRQQPVAATTMIDRVAANNIYDVANYALNQ